MRIEFNSVARTFGVAKMRSRRRKHEYPKVEYERILELTYYSIGQGPPTTHAMGKSRVINISNWIDLILVERVDLELWAAY